MRRTTQLLPVLLAWLTIAVLAPALRAERWKLQYFYDEAHTQLQLTDLAFPSAQRGVAVGWIQATNSDRKPEGHVGGYQRWRRALDPDAAQRRTAIPVLSE